jgi:putative transposase
MVSKFVIDETQLNVGSEYIGLCWVAIEPKDKKILSISISKERNMFGVAEGFLSNLIKIMTIIQILPRWWWYVVVSSCQFLKLNHHIHTSFEKSIIIERTMQYIKDRTKECFDDYFLCGKKKCKLKHVQQWLNLFVNYYNKYIIA